VPKPKHKAGDKDNRERYVALYYDELESMAFKTLSPNAVWLLLQYRAQWNGTFDRLVLPFGKVNWKLTFKAFDLARRELIDAGFLRVVETGGLYGKPTIYALSDTWKTVTAMRLAADPDAGYLKNYRVKGKAGVLSVWYPAKKRTSSAENWKKAALALVHKRQREKRTPKKNSKHRASQERQERVTL